MIRSIALASLFLASLTVSAVGADFEGAKVITYFGYASAIELTNASVKVVLCPEVGGRVLEYSLKGKNSLYLSDAEKSWDLVMHV